MIRAIIVPPDVPDNFEEIIVLFAKAAKRGESSETMMHFSGNLLESLKGMSLSNRYRVIKQLCRNMEEMLLQSSSNPTEVNIRNVGGDRTC